MNNQVTVLMSAEIPELCEELDLLRSVAQDLNADMADCKSRVNLNDLGDWNLVIQINLRNTNGIRIFKRFARLKILIDRKSVV